MMERLIKIAEGMDQKMPGVKRYLMSEKTDETYFHSNRSPTDIEYLETEDYQVVAAKWEEHHWKKKPYSGVGWNEWVEIYYAKSGQEPEGRRTRMVATRDKYNSSFDRKDLWGHEKVNLEKIGKNKITVAWQNGKGHIVMQETYEITPEGLVEENPGRLT